MRKHSIASARVPPAPTQTSRARARGAGGECAAVRASLPAGLRAFCGGAVAAALAGGLYAVPAAAQQEVSAEIIAAQIRRQGFPCDEALRAERESHAANAAVWTLRCKNATYRVRLTPDMAAQVERIEEGNPSSRPERCERYASSAPNRDLGRFVSLQQVPDRFGLRPQLPG